MSGGCHYLWLHIILVNLHWRLYPTMKFAIGQAVVYALYKFIIDVK